MSIEVKEELLELLKNVYEASGELEVNTNLVILNIRKIITQKK